MAVDIIQLTLFDHNLGDFQTGVSAVDEVDGLVAGVDQQVVAVVILQDLGVAAQVQVCVSIRSQI